MRERSGKSGRRMRTTAKDRRGYELLIKNAVRENEGRKYEEKMKVTTVKLTPDDRDNKRSTTS